MGWEFYYEKTWLPAPTPNPNPPAAPLKDIGPATVGGFVSSSGTVSIVAGGPYQYMLGFPALIDTEVGLQLILWYAQTPIETPGLNWQPGDDPPGPSVLSDTSSLGLALAVPAWLQPVANSSVGAAEFLAWTGTDEAHTVNVAAALADDPTNADASATRNDYVKTTFWGQTSQLPTSVASIPHADSSVAVIAWAGTGNLQLNLLNQSTLPGATAGSQAILEETSPCGPNLSTAPYFVEGGFDYLLWLSWVGTDPGASLNILNFNPLSTPAGIPEGVGSGLNAWVVQTPSACTPAVVGSAGETPCYMTWIDRGTGKLAVASANGIQGPWQNMTLYNLVDAYGNELQPWPNGGVSIVATDNPSGLLVACVDSQYQTARVFSIPTPGPQ
jgi:hypothetical protein